MTILIILLPLLNFLTLGLLGRTFGKKGAIALSIFLLLATAMFVGILFPQTFTTVMHTTLFTWITSGLFKIMWGFICDSLTITMFLVVSIVSAVVHIYSTEYMSNDPHIVRFLAYLSLFTFFMLVLVSGENVIVMFLGWEGVGLCSYLLISFWFTRVNAVKSASKAIIVNRVGDFGLTIGMCLIFLVFQTGDFPVFLAIAELFNPALNAIAFLLFIGAMAKSAQVFLHTWLPDAMEGPTPVSALIHAATMVTAGVFLVIKTSIIFENASSVLLIVTLIGALTSFFAATSGLVQSDIKKVIAYSTCSQLGYMFFICGLSGYVISLFHLANHAFFKALLFLTAGAVIHSVLNEQDMRRFGELLNQLPITFTLLVIGSLALMGFPFLTGYYSKDLIIEYAASNGSYKGACAALLGILTAGVTSYYSMRLIFFTFLTTATFRSITKQVHELTNTMLISLIPLVVGSIFLGQIAKDMFVGPGSSYFSIYTKPSNNILIEAEFSSLIIKFLPFIISVGAIIPLLLASILFDTGYVRTRLFSFLTAKWYFDAIFNRCINVSILKFSYNTVFKSIDKGLIERFGPNGYGYLGWDIGYRVSKLAAGPAPTYAKYLVYGAAVLSLMLNLSFS